ncbi:MAG: AI-2E family transporter [Acidobacteria bacterium]|nr:AI-2E family transporter [Acidobacteriota bacterium]
MTSSAHPSLPREVAGTLWRFLHGQALITAILTAFHTVAFYLIGLPAWWLAGPVVGLLTLVPYFGFLVGAGVACLVALLAGGGLWDVVRLLLVMAAGQALEGLYLTPKILGRELNLNPLLVFGAVLAGLLMFGPLGAFLAAPALAVFLIVWKHAKRRRGVS